jgi:hypothetical protein
MVASRDSIGYELDAAFDDRVRDVPDFSETVARRRLDDHRAFVERKLEAGEEFEYQAEFYDFPVTTKQERRLRLYSVRAIEETEEGYRAVHEPVANERAESEPFEGT